MSEGKEEARLAKNARIGASRRVTASKRKHQVCKTYDFKVVSSHVSRKQADALRAVFREAKWLRNDCLAHGIDGYVAGKTVSVHLPDGSSEERELTHLGSQIRQSVIEQVKSDRRGLAAKRKRGHRVGRLKFTRRVSCVHLKQFGTTYRFTNDRHTRVRIQKIPGTLRVIGADQVGADAEFASANLVERADGYHLLVTCYYDRKPSPHKAEDVPLTAVGVDMGLKDSVVCSDGRKVRACFYETERLRHLRRRLSRQRRGSKGYAQTKRKIDRELLRLSYRKDDVANKLVHDLLKNDYVFFQDESIGAWKARRGFVKGGRTVQASILGRVKGRLKAAPNAVMLPKGEPTTASCPVCGARTKHHPSRRTFVCSCCGHTADRDVHAACNMIRLGTKYLPVERRNTEVERMSDMTDQELSLMSQHAFLGEAWKPQELALG